MQKIFVEKPYRFVPPIRSARLQAWARDLGVFLWWLKRTEGVESCEVRHADRLLQSVRAGHGVLVTPNHPRTADPLTLGYLARETKLAFYAMASWHLFQTSMIERTAIRLMGGFSVYREGIDRQAIDMAVETLTPAERPLVIFPEGTATRVNDRLLEMLDGISFIARTAAKRRAKQHGGSVVVHPVAIKYLLRSDLKQMVEPMVADLEKRLTFRPPQGGTLRERITRIGAALLALKEVEYFGEPRSGLLSQRQRDLVERLMQPLEIEWLGKVQTGGIVARVKNVRMKVFPEIARGEVKAEERDRRYRQLADTYLAQQIALYPEGYLEGSPSAERLWETLERFEEDLNDEVRPRARWHAIVEVLPAIEVDGARDRGAETDPMISGIRDSLQKKLDELSEEATAWDEQHQGT